MATISQVSRVVAGVQRQVDLSTNILAVGSLMVGGLAGTTLTKIILDNLVSLQNGSEVGGTLHTHSSIYFTKTLLQASTTGSAGTTLIGDDNSYIHFSNAGLTLKSALTAIDGALGAATASTAFDGTFAILNTADNTKKILFSASAITTGQSRTISMPDSNVNLGLVATAIQRDGSVVYTASQPMGGFKLTSLAAGTTAGDSVRYQQAILTSGTNPFIANQDMGGFKITGSADPTNPQDLSTKAYVDAVAIGLSPKKAARVGTTANITLSGTQTIDTVAVVAGDRVLVKNQTSAAQNGIYVVSAGTWSRSTDMSSTSPIDQFNGAWVPVQLGSQAGEIFAQYGAVAIIGTDPVNFEFYNPLASLIGGDMITVSGSTISVDLAATSGLESSIPGNVAGQLRVKIEATNPTLQIDASNQLGVRLFSGSALAATASGLSVVTDSSTLEIAVNTLRIKDAGVTLAKHAPNSVDESKIVSTSFSATGAVSGGSGAKITVLTDATTIEIATNALRIKDAGVSAAKISTGAYDQKTILGGAGTAASVASSPSIAFSGVAGQAFNANTTYAVRFGVTSNGETVSRLYAADITTASYDLFWVIGFIQPTSAVIASGTVNVIQTGQLSLLSSDTAFSATDPGKAMFLQSGGTNASTATPAISGQAVAKLGIVTTTSSFFAHISAPYVY